MALNIDTHTFRIWVVTLSDRASRGTYEDLSGPEAVRLLTFFFETRGWKAEFKTYVIPDDAQQLLFIAHGAIEEGIDLLVTSGGTGIGPRDITPDTLLPLLDKQITGVMDFIRLKYGAEKPAALLSRAIAGIAGKTLVYTLPGSPKAVKEYLTEIIQGLEHTFYMLHGIDRHG
ncbi:MAG: MogA/MoaB family molybdenum cofactor biosynthesis protein [Bacteroidales bacterium]|jgi:molybdenum cofactor synthesis domain-containing protein